MLIEYGANEIVNGGSVNWFNNLEKMFSSIYKS